VRALRDLDEPSLAAGKHGLDPQANFRARHVVTENARTLAAAHALEQNDLRLLGKIMAASHASMRDDFAITVPKIDNLVAILQQAIGPQGGARMTGGGFGGAVIGIMRQEEISRVRAIVEARYRTPNGALPPIMIETASCGATHLIRTSDT
jgi:galactokinase